MNGLPERPSWDELAKRDEENRIHAASKGLAAMHLRYGLTPGQRCGDCVSCIKVHGDHKIVPNKCKEYKITNGAATDWRLKWPACGRFVDRRTAKETAEP